MEWTPWSHLAEGVTPLEAVGVIIYTYYFYFFLLASLILLVAMIGAIVLTLHKGVAIKHQEVFQQNTREFAKTVGKLTKGTTILWKVGCAHQVLILDEQ